MEGQDGALVQGEEREGQGGGVEGGGAAHDAAWGAGRERGGQVEGDLVVCRVGQDGLLNLKHSAGVSLHQESTHGTQAM